MPQEPKLRRAARFRAGTPEMVVIAILTIIGAVLLIWAAAVIRAVDCGADSDSECSGKGLAQLLIAVAGGLPAFATLFESLRPGRGRPWRWLLVTAAVYIVWGVFLLR
jgi:MFS superfamily sulfate permease-like transporter